MFRRIIKFGDSSHVISLPKKWIDKNNLKKGDLVVCNEETNELRILPHIADFKQNAKEITITLTENDKGRVKHKISSAYVNNYGLINIIADDLLIFVQEIRIATSNLMALEIIQQTSKKIVLKDFLDIKEISIIDTIRRIDLILLSISEDVLKSLSGFDLLEGIKQKEMDVNRLSFLLWKVLKKCSDNKVRQILDVTHDEVLFYWDIVLNLERIADNFKRLPRYVDGKLSDLKVEFVKDLIEIYKLIMKAFYKSDLDIAVKIKEEIKEMFINSEKVFSGHGNSIMSEKIKNILQGTSNIATQIILFPSEKRY
ncbi:phosphate uptake regulator PhoU [Candidatus Woesearchaeota archaeon]|nr:phosphate uptake regulator PhoU [Candidatus Woesearchaeota archaeon]